MRRPVRDGATVNEWVVFRCRGRKSREYCMWLMGEFMRTDEAVLGLGGA